MVHEKTPHLTVQYQTFYFLFDFIFTGCSHFSLREVQIISWQSLRPQSKLVLLHIKFLEFVKITSINVGL